MQQQLQLAFVCRTTLPYLLRWCAVAPCKSNPLYDSLQEAGAVVFKSFMQTPAVALAAAAVVLVLAPAVQRAATAVLAE
jgi:hypothetical protein